MSKTYTANITKLTARGMRGRIVGEVFEDGLLIGTFVRGAIQSGYVPPIESKFFSDKARDRFCGFADCLSIGETIEALAFPL